MKKTSLSPRHILIRCICLFVACVLGFSASIQTARADGAPPPEPDMGGVAPYHPIETNVQMMAETVLIDVLPHPTRWTAVEQSPLDSNMMKVKASFTLRNQGAAEEKMQVIFPLTRLDYPWLTSSYNIVESSFIAIVNGTPVPTTRLSTPPELKAFPEDGGDMELPDGFFVPDVQWAGFEVTFPVQQDVIVEVKYDMRGYIEMGLQHVDYILETGAGWYGRILSADINVHLPYPATSESVPGVPPGCVFSGKEVQCKRTNFEPKRKDNLAFGLLDTNEWSPTLELRSRVEQYPDDADAWYRLAERYRWLGFWRDVVINQHMVDLSAEALEKAVALRPELADTPPSFELTATPKPLTATPAPIPAAIQKVTAMAVANYHTCVLTAGEVKCQVSDQKIRVIDDFKAVVAGDLYTCLLTMSGGVKCMGRNNFGQLGDGTRLYRDTPVDVKGLTRGITALAAGDNHTCALTTSGGVKCWGRNYFGELGDGTMAYSLVPVDVKGLDSGVAKLAAGSDHTCAFMQMGGIKCWGASESGQLGDGSLVDRLEPVDIVNLPDDITTLTAGFAHTCALNSQGQVMCWGDNSHGQLGDEDYDVHTTPVIVPGLDSGVVKVAAGNGYTCALTSQGGVKCWGRNDPYENQLGDGTETDRSAPDDVPGLTSGAADIAAGNAHTCALMQNGKVRCWGWTYYGYSGVETDYGIQYASTSASPLPMPKYTPVPLPTSVPTETSSPIMDSVWDLVLLIAIGVLVLLWRRSKAGHRYD